MKKLVHHNRPRAEQLAASAVAVAVAVAVGIAAAQASAAPSVSAKLVHGALTINGGDASDKITLRLEAGEPGVLQVDTGDDGSADFRFERADIAMLAINGGDGDDLVRIDEVNGAVNAGIPTTLRGGDGDDTLAGGSGAETLRGGAGSDSIDGNRGEDVGLMGEGDDLFVWDPGDGSDIVEGQDGHDTMLFNGAPGPEQMDLSANARRFKLFRTQGTITMDTAGVERVDVNALGGTDTVTVNDLTGTDVTSVNVDLANALGGSIGDGVADRVVVNATDGNDAIDVSGDAGGVKVGGLAASIEILHAEVANDRLQIDTRAGTDSVDSGGLAAGAIQLFVDGLLVP
jgi:RTX calcium-binding nonapeptide repeat (4 copies)